MSVALIRRELLSTANTTNPDFDLNFAIVNQSLVEALWSKPGPTEEQIKRRLSARRFLYSSGCAVMCERYLEVPPQKLYQLLGKHTKWFRYARVCRS